MPGEAGAAPQRQSWRYSLQRPLHSARQERTRAHPLGKDAGEAPGSGQAGTRLRSLRPGLASAPRSFEGGQPP